MYMQEGWGRRLQTCSHPAWSDSSCELLPVGNVAGRQCSAGIVAMWFGNFYSWWDYRLNTLQSWIWAFPKVVPLLWGGFARRPDKSHDLRCRVFSSAYNHMLALIINSKKIPKKLVILEWQFLTLFIKLNLWESKSWLGNLGYLGYYEGVSFVGELPEEDEPVCSKVPLSFITNK